MCPTTAYYQVLGSPQQPCKMQSRSLKCLTILASIMGIAVVPMDIDRQREEKRDAILVTALSQRINV